MVCRGDTYDNSKKKIIVSSVFLFNVFYDKRNAGISQSKSMSSNVSNHVCLNTSKLFSDSKAMMQCNAHLRHAIDFNRAITTGNHSNKEG